MDGGRGKGFRLKKIYIFKYFFLKKMVKKKWGGEGNAPRKLPEVMWTSDFHTNVPLQKRMKEEWLDGQKLGGGKGR